MKTVHPQRSSAFRRVGGPAAALVAAVVAAACGGGSGGGERGEVGGELDTAIVSLAVASEVGVDGAVEPEFVFAPDQEQVAVVAGVGEVAGPLELTWYRVGGDGDEELFAHTVDVGPADRAFSTGVSPGSLAEGSYRVVAEIDGEGREVWWWVQPEWVAALEDPASPEAVLAAAEAAAGSDTPAGDPPVGGDSGVLPGGDEASPPDGECFLQLHGDLRHAWSADIVEFSLTASHCEEGELVLSASAGGPVKEIGGLPLPLDDPLTHWWLDPCGLEDGSDLPGTEGEITAEVRGPEAGSSSTSAAFSLGSDQTLPVVEIETDPPAGTKVEPGDVITIEVTGSELRQPGTTWQTGVERVLISATGIGFFADESFGDAPLPCDDKSWTQTLTTTYTVPPDPPATITMTALAKDFAHYWGVSETLLFPTTDTEHWSGTFRFAYQATDTVWITCTVSAEGEIRLVVEDGEVTGTIDASETQGCPDDPGSGSGSAGLAGSFDGNVFQFQYRTVTGDPIRAWICLTDAPAPRVGPPGTASEEWTRAFPPQVVYDCSITLEREDPEPVG